MAIETIQSGVWSVVPALLAISLAWYTRDAIIGLFLGVTSAALIYGGLQPAAAGVPDAWVGTTLGTVAGVVFGLKLVPDLIASANLFGSLWYIKNVLLAIFAIGGLIGLMIRSGAIRGVLEALTERVESAEDAEKATFLAGIVVHIDDYFNCLVVGTMMRPLTDKYNVSRAKLAYYVDSAGSPAARLAFYSTWGAAMVGFIGAGLVQAKKQGILPDAYSEFVTTTSGGDVQAVADAIWPLFFNTLFTGFYSWAALGLAALVAWQVFPNVGGMAEEERRARSGGGVLGEEHNPMISEEMADYEMYEGATPDWKNFLVPILTMVVVGLLAMFWTGEAIVSTGPTGSLALNIGGVQLGLASMSALVVAFVLYRVRGDIPSNEDAVDAVVVGMKGIFLAAVILLFATAIQNAVTTLGISSFVTNVFSGVPGWIVPVALFLTSSFVSFSDGSSWSTYGIMFPIAIPIAFTTPANLILVLGAVFSGGIFGDHCSPISDTTVLASSTSGADHMVHVRTQIPYALVSAGIAATLFLVLGFVLPEGWQIIPY
ncbi:Na+/H+ antiporter NhaC family protein [Halospeciosus flavus]|uniref:Na+/H+ antiporter NhaC family protein n=1 Tax=Halospeciosus flavus TaxID=3032283 RepID=A0ABD5Z988_9EURY|nr:Na+/H+ antiporter NhaC family protein [Halospeciosus flavus]